ncbi:leucine-rich repeat extensin-like protein 3 [Salvia miltiorrhiza]|uniref:leucine-rich repeat extensin-like protein 3 n=1 Tax=Salvia miltiorrhiza TaxID=226208 RepID=UPI0025ABBEDD|nr:leucine-rich repeat extensin-like protein 3 [Salvia miltiorrhiza]
MASSNLLNILSTLLFLSTILDFLPTATPQECPYPCYPPPIGPGNGPPATTTPPASTTPPAALSPPANSFTTPPAGYIPFTPPSPYFSGAVPPPPEPILPWFPFYYRKPPHQDQSSSSPPATGSTNLVLFIFPLLLVCHY